MKQLFAAFIVLFLITPISAFSADEKGDDKSHGVGMPIERTVLDKYRWCQKRFDHGYKWDKVNKRCIKPKK